MIRTHSFSRNSGTMSSIRSRSRLTAVLRRDSRDSWPRFSRCTTTWIEAKKQTFSSFNELLAQLDKLVFVDFYVTWGEPKCWYRVPGYAATTFEQIMRNALQDLFDTQTDLLFQLVTMLNPSVLQRNGVSIYSVG